MEGLATVPKKVTKGNLVISDADVARIDKAYQPAIDKMLELAPEVVKCFEMEKGDEQTKLAKELHSKYVNIRTTTHSKIHKPIKASFTQQGKYCDLHKKTRDEIGGPIEAKLKEIKDAAKIEKEKNEAELQKLRENELSQYLEPTAEMIPDLGKMDAVIWYALLKGTKATFELNNRDEADEKRIAKEKADFQSETMRRYNLLIPLQRFATDETKKNYATLPLSDFEAVLLEAKMLSNEADKELAILKSKNEELTKEVETVTAEKEVVIQEKEVVVQQNESFHEKMSTKFVANQSGATDKEKMEAYVLDLRTVMDRYTFTDPKFVDVLVKSNNYIMQLIGNIEKFNV